MKSVVSSIKDCCFCAIGWSNVSTNEDIRSVGPSQPEMMGLPTGLGWKRLMRKKKANERILPF